MRESAGDSRGNREPARARKTRRPASRRRSISAGEKRGRRHERDTRVTRAQTSSRPHRGQTDSCSSYPSPVLDISALLSIYRRSLWRSSCIGDKLSLLRRVFNGVVSFRVLVAVQAIDADLCKHRCASGKGSTAILNCVHLRARQREREREREKV